MQVRRALQLVILNIASLSTAALRLVFLISVLIDWRDENRQKWLSHVRPLARMLWRIIRILLSRVIRAQILIFGERARQCEMSQL